MLDRSQNPMTATGEAPALPLVMLPGTLCDARLYAGVLDHLDVEAHIPVLTGATTAGELAARLLRDLPARFVLCGFSLGAIVALEIAAQAPSRVERLALIGCNPGSLSPDAADARRAVTHDQFVEASYRHTTPAIHRRLREMAEATPPNIYDQQTAITLSRIDSRPRLRLLTMPTLILCGADDRICPPALSIEMADAIPHTRLRLIDGAGHYLPIEQPERVASEISAWLATPTDTLH